MLVFVDMLISNVFPFSFLKHDEILSYLVIIWPERFLGNLKKNQISKFKIWKKKKKNYMG